MKKSLCILLTAILVLALTLPAFIISAEIVNADGMLKLNDSLGKSYKFTFGEDGDRYDYGSMLNKTAEYKGLTYYPVWNYTDYDSKNGALDPTFEYKTMYDDNGENGVDVLNIKGPTSTYLTLLTEDGTPFEVLPGREYSVKVKMYFETDTDYSQMYVSLGGNVNRTDKWHDDDYNNTSTKMTLFGSRGAATRDGIIYNSISNSSMTYKRSQTNRPVTVNGLTPNNGQNWNSKVYGYTTSTAKLLDKTYYLGVPENSECEADAEVAVYDTDSDLITFNLPYFSRSELTAETTDASELTVKGTQTDHNFLTLFIQGEKYLSDGTTPFSYSIESIEITELGELIDADKIDSLQDSLGTSYKFTFGEDGDRFDYSSALNQNATYKGLSYYPVWNYTDYDASGTNKPTITYKTMYDANGENGVDVLNIQGPTNTYLTLLDKDGKPFEVMPGKEYKVSVKAYCETDTNYSQMYVSLGGNVKRTDKWYDDDYNNTNPTYTLYGSRGSTTQKNIKYNSETVVTQPNRFITDNQFTPNNGGTGTTGHYGDNTFTARVSDRTTYLGVPANLQCNTDDPVAVYDTANDLITFNLPLVKKADITTITGTQVNHNFLTLFISGGTYTDGAGTVHPFSYSIESIEITEVGDSVKNKALTATASASTETEGHTAALLNDGIISDDNYWTPTDAELSQNVQFSWRQLTAFDSVRLFELAREGAYSADGFYIEVSKDGSIWEKVYEGSVIGDSFEANFSRTVWARYLKVTFTDLKDGATLLPALREIEVYANGTGATSRNYAKSAELSASSVTTTGPIANIIDGDRTNRYIPSDYASLPLEIQFKWDAAIAFDTVNIFEWKDGNGDYRANNISLEYSLNGEDWSLLHEGVGIGQELNITTDEPTVAKYLRLKMKDIKEGLPSTYMPCICEFEIYKTRDNANVLAFSSGSVAEIDEEDSKILLETVPGTDLSELTPTVTVEKGASYSPKDAQDFSKPVIYSVTSANGKIVREYEVTVKEKEYLTDSDLSDKGSEEVSAYGPTPSPNQYAYQKQEMAAFCHFGMKTFLGLELVTKPYDISNWTLDTPADTDGYVKALKDAGFDKVIFTAKHHDGLCMWDTKWTDYNVTNTVYGADFLAELSASCNKYDMDMGLYLQPWDVHTEYYGYFDENGDPCDEEDDVLDYNDFYAGQLEEILGNDKYGHNGKFNEIWLDGANLGNKPQTYDFDRYLEVMYRNEGDDVLIFGVTKAAKITWVGNESGKANEETWSKGQGTYNAETGKWEVTWYGPTVKYNGSGACMGVKNGNVWLVNESDTVVTSGWFWGENKKTPKTLEQLRDIYLDTVGHNSVLLLNVPFNTSGTLDEDIKNRIKEFGDNVDASFETDNLLEQEGVTVSASEVLNGDTKFKPSNVFDGNDNTYWTAENGTKEATLHIDFGKKVTFDSVVLEEAIQFGQRVESFKILYKNSSGKWVEFSSGTTIGGKRVALENAVTSSELLIYFTGMETSALGVGTPVISHVGVYKSTADFQKDTGAPDGIETYDSADTGTFAAASWDEVDHIDTIAGGYIKGSAGQTMSISFHGTKAWLMGNKGSEAFSFKYSIDGGEEKTVNYTPTEGAEKQYCQILFETDDLADTDHTVRLEVLSGTVEVDALFVLNNEGRGYLEFENSSYTVNEDMSYEIKIVRKGGTKGSISALIQDMPGSAVQTHYYNTEGLIVNFAEGEKEKTFTLRTMRYADKTGTLSFSLEVISADADDTTFASGFNNPVQVDIIDAESYSGDYLTSFKIDTLPHKLTYRTGDKLDLTGLKIKAGYVTGDSRILFDDQYDVSCDTLTESGAVRITLTSKYGGLSDSFTVTVFANGDVNKDGDIDITDLVSLSNGAGDTTDIDRDGKTDGKDAALLRSHLIGASLITEIVSGSMTDIVADSAWTEQTTSSDADLSQVVLNKLEEVGGNIGHSVYRSDFESEPTAAAGTLPSGWQFGKNSGLDWSSSASNASIKELAIDAKGTTKKGINIYSTNSGSTVISTAPLGTNSYVAKATFYYLGGRHSSEANFRFFSNVSDTSLANGVAADKVIFYGETTSGTFQQPSINCNGKWYNTATYVGSDISKYTKVDIELISYNGYNHYFINGKLMASVAKTDRGINDDVIGFTAWCADYHITDLAVYALTDEGADTTLYSDKFSANYIIAENTSDKWKNAEITLEKLDDSGEVVNTVTLSANTVIICEEGSTYRFSVKVGTKSDSIEQTLKNCGIRLIATEKLELSRYSDYKIITP